MIPHPKRKEILVIPNGVDQDFFKPIKAEKQYDIVFTGNMAYPPNVNAATFFWLMISCQLFGKVFLMLNFFLAGATPDASVRQTASAKLL